MAATTTGGQLESSFGIATVEEIRAAFAEHKEELMWVAEFLTDDALMASACIADAKDLTVNNSKDEVCQECVQLWVQEATIRSALDLKRVRIGELSSTYEHRDRFGAQEHPPMSASTIEFVVRESEMLRSRLDTLCRFVLVLCGFKQRSAAEAALLLGISKDAVAGAYRTALESLTISYCQVVLDAYGHAAA